MVSLSRSLLIITSLFIASAKCEYIPNHLWYQSFRINADHTVPSLNFNPNSVRRGDSIWMDSKNLPVFFSKYYHKIPAPFVLVTGGSDTPVPTALKKYFDVTTILKKGKILKWFVQNYDGSIRSKLFHPIPIGIDFHTLAKKRYFGNEKQSIEEQQQELEEIIKYSCITNSRIPKVYADFHLTNSSKKHKETRGEDRLDIYNQLKANDCILFQKGSCSRSELWREKSKYAFSISPHGNGLDCHRTWEDLALGCIVIVKTSSLDSLYKDLPVVIVADWNEINEDNLKKWLEKFSDASINPKFRQKLTNNYWTKQVRNIK